MEQKGHYRHELKYNISYWQYLQIRSRLRQMMQMDPHTGKNRRIQFTDEKCEYCIISPRKGVFI